MDRYVAAYLSDRVGAVFSGKIGGVTRFGLFVTLSETGADGLVPVSSLPDDFYDHDEGLHCLIGRRTGRMFRLGTAVKVRLVEADAISGSMVFHLADPAAAEVPAHLRPAFSPLRSGKTRRRAQTPAPDGLNAPRPGRRKR